MRAIVRDEYGPPEVMRLEELPTPEPSEGEVLVRVVAASINTADIDQLRGRPLAARLGTGWSAPRRRRLGLDVAGRVEATGEGVTRFRPGEEVWADLFAAGSGAFSEFVCVPEGALLPKPSGLEFEQAAALPHSGVLALQGLTARRPVENGQTVLINGAGGCVGPLAIQIAASFGAEVTSVDHTDKLDLMRSVGADHVVDYTRDDVTKQGRRFDHILDVASNRSVLAFRRSLEADGAYVRIAHSLAGFFSAAALGALISAAGSKRMGVFTWAPNRRDDMERLATLVTSGGLTPVVDRICGLSEVPDAIRAMEAGETRGKVVVVPG